MQFAGLIGRSSTAAGQAPAERVGMRRTTLPLRDFSFSTSSVGELLLRIGSALHALRGRDRDLVRPWKTRAESVWSRHSLRLRSSLPAYREPAWPTLTLRWRKKLGVSLESLERSKPSVLS